MRLAVRPALVAGALAAFAAAACNDVPFAPRWDADWYVPLASRNITLPAGVIPAGVSVSDSFPTQTQSLGNAAGQILSRTLDSAQVIFTLTKSAAVALDDTLFVAANTADLTNPNANRIALRISMSAAATSFMDTLAITPAGVGLLSGVAGAKGDLYIQLRGTVSNPGPGIVIISASNNQVGVRLALLARIGISTRGS